jgi:hypothetical protein
LGEECLSSLFQINYILDMKIRLIISGLIFLGTIAVLANLYLIKKTPSLDWESFPEESIPGIAEYYISQGCSETAGALPISIQLDALKAQYPSRELEIGIGLAFGKTKIAAKNQAFNMAKKELSLKSRSSGYPINTIFSCYTPKDNGIEVFLVLAIKK